MPSFNTWKKLQAASGLTFGFFLTMHLLSHLSLNLGWETAQENLLFFRNIYQHPVFEVTLLASTLLHMTSNTVIMSKRGKMGGQKKVESDLKGHRYAGYMLAASVFFHAAATRLAPYIFLEDPSQYDYSFLTKVNSMVPYNFFSVYLVVFGMSGLYHLVYGTRSAIGTLAGSSIAGKPLPGALKIFTLFGQAMILNAILALMGYYYVVDTETKTELHSQIFDNVGI